MGIDDLKLVDKLEKECGNRYLVVQFLSKAARQLGKQKKEYHLSESKLLQWILTGKCPYNAVQLECRKKHNSDDGLEDMLCWIMDSEIRDCIRQTYRLSIKHRTLQTYQNTRMSPRRVDRINIILRMIWYSENI